MSKLFNFLFKNLGELGTICIASSYTSALLIISLPFCMSPTAHFLIFVLLVGIGAYLFIKKKILQQRWVVWFFVFLFLNFTSGSFVAGKLQDCACTSDAKYCDVEN